MNFFFVLSWQAVLHLYLFFSHAYLLYAFAIVRHCSFFDFYFVFIFNALWPIRRPGIVWMTRTFIQSFQLVICFQYVFVIICAPAAC